MHVGGIEGISCQHLQVMMTQLPQKHWEWQEDRRHNVWHRSENRPTMYTGSMDIKTASDHIAKCLVEQDTYGWITAAMLSGMEGLEGHATFEDVERRFNLTRRIRQGSVEAPTLWLKLAKHILWNAEQEWTTEGDGRFL